MEEDVPTNRLFGEGIVFSSELFDAVSAFTVTWESIDWQQTAEVPQALQEALVTAATQFQYGNMSHVVLCGNIIRNELDDTVMDLQKLATILAAYRLEGIELWGRYVEKMDGTATISNELQRYCQHLFSEEDALTLVVMMSVLSGPLTHTVYEALQGQGDDLFNELIQNLAVQKKNELDLITTFLEPVISSRSWETQRELADTVQQYDRIAQGILATNQSALRELQIDPVLMRGNVSMAIDEFCAGLHIPEV